MANRTVSVSLVAKMDGFKAGMKQGEAAAKDFGGELENMRRRSANINDISLAMGGLGAVMAGLAGWAIKAGMEFDKQMSAVQAVTGATAEELDKLRQAALQAGKDTSFSATEAAKAQEELAKAGLTTAQILDGGLNGALSLAAAGSLDLAEAADIAAKTMNTFGLEAGDVGHIADMLAGAANATATDVHEMGEALRMGGLAAHNAGISMDDTIAVLGAFADHALVGSDAGTSLKTMLQMLAAPTGKSAQLMKELGIEAYDTSGQFVGMERLAGELKEALGPLTMQQRNAALATIFGADAMRAATILMGQGAEGIQEYTAKIGAQADASATAAAKTDNLAGDIDRLKGSLETLAIEASSGANGGLRMIVQALDSLVSWFSDLPGPVQTAITLFAGIGGATLIAAAGFLKLKQTVGDALEGLRDMGKVGGGVATAISGIGRAFGIAGLAVGGVMLVAEGLDRILGDRAVKPVVMARDVEALTGALKNFAQTGTVIGEMANTFGPKLEGLSFDLQVLATDFQTIRESWGKYADNAVVLAEVQMDFNEKQAQAKTNIEALDKALAGMVSSGHTTAAKLAYEELAAKVKASGGSVEQLNALLPQYATEAGKAAVATSSAAQGFGTAEQNARTMARTWDEAIQKGQTLRDLFYQLNGAALGFSDAQIRAEQAADNLDEAISKNKVTFDKHTGAILVNDDAGRKVRGGMNELMKAAAEATQKRYEETGSVEEAQKTWRTYAGRLDTAMQKAGLTKDAQKRLRDEIGKMPPLKTTNVNVNVKVSGTGALAALETKLANLSGQAARLAKFADTNISWKGATGGPSGSNTMQRAAGGPINMGQTYLVGENGPEYVTATRHEYVHPNGSGALSKVEVGPVKALVDNKAIALAVADALRNVTVVMDGQAVGYLQGRRAELLVRGG